MEGQVELRHCIVKRVVPRHNFGLDSLLLLAVHGVSFDYECEILGVL